MNRRSFFAFLAGLPLVGRLVPQVEAEEEPVWYVQYPDDMEFQEFRHGTLENWRCFVDGVLRRDRCWFARSASPRSVGEVKRPNGIPALMPPTVVRTGSPAGNDGTIIWAEWFFGPPGKLHCYSLGGNIKVGWDVDEFEMVMRDSGSLDMVAELIRQRAFHTLRIEAPKLADELESRSQRKFDETLLR